MYCPECGKKSADAFARFCGSCGNDMKSLGVDGGSQASTPAPVSQPAGPAATVAPRGRAARLSKVGGRGEDLGGGEVNIEEFDASSIELTEEDFICEATDTKTQKMYFQGS